MNILEVIKRLNYTKNLYELTIIPMLNDKRDIPDAKKDIKALEIAIALLEERSNKSAGSEEIYTK